MSNINVNKNSHYGLYYKIIEKLIYKGYWGSDVSAQKKMIEEALFNEVVIRIKEEYPETLRIIDISDIDLIELLGYIDIQIYTYKEKNEFFMPYICCILNAISDMQSNNLILWSMEPRYKASEGPKGVVNEDGLLEKIQVPEGTDPLLLLEFLMEIFRNKICIDNKETSDKQKTK